MSVTAAMMMVDTFEAMKIVSKHPDVDSSRLGITGWSLGGTVSFYSFWEPLAEKLAPDGERFKCCLPFILQLTLSLRKIGGTLDPS